MKMKIRLIMPANVSAGDFDKLADIRNLIREDVEIDVVALDSGPSSILNQSDMDLLLAGTVDKIIEAQQDGIGAVVIDCMGDPGVAEGRRLVTIPVVGPSQTAMHVASTLGEKFAVISHSEIVIPIIAQNARSYHLERKLCAILSINIDPLDLSKDILLSSELIYQKSLIAIREYGANTIVLGCNLMGPCLNTVKSKLLKVGIDVPIIDGRSVAINYAELLLRNKLTYSKNS